MRETPSFLLKSMCNFQIIGCGSRMVTKSESTLIDAAAILLRLEMFVHEGSIKRSQFLETGWQENISKNKQAE
jgi:hypothetical protein